jgi:hypothetical protein
METEITRKTPPKGTPERREYDRDAKTRSRQKEKQEREEKEIVTAHEWFDRFRASAKYREVRNCANEQHRTISEELGIDQKAWSNHPAYYAVDMTLLVSYGYEKDFVRRVVEPAGVMVSGTFFPDAAGVIVADANRYGLERSPTFSGIYRPLLALLNKKFGRNDDNHARAIREELAGTYKLEAVT